MIRRLPTWSPLGASRDRIVSGDRLGSLVLDGSRAADAADGVDPTRQLRHIGNRHDPRSSWRLANMPGICCQTFRLRHGAHQRRTVRTSKYAPC
jgi:hypothetical protein